MQLSAQNDALVKRFAPLMTEVIEWWAYLLKESNGNLAGIGEAAQSIMAPWNMLAMNDSTFGPTILPCVLQCLASKNNTVRTLHDTCSVSLPSSRTHLHSLYKCRQDF